MEIQNSKFKIQNPQRRPLTPWLWVFVLAALLLINGCASSRSSSVAAARPFEFSHDTFAYPNELCWEYHFDAAEHGTFARRQPPPAYTHHCFVVARAARQFFLKARFDPARPRGDTATYRKLIRRVITQNPRRAQPAEERIVIPGYASLREFSAAHEPLLKAECGGAWQSYVQRGHWRMIFPVSRRHQERVAQQLACSVKQKGAAVAHVYRFPKLSINHAILLFAAHESASEITFTAYDPNAPAASIDLVFERSTSAFTFPRTDYFPGGRVAVYEVYCAWNY